MSLKIPLDDLNKIFNGSLEKEQILIFNLPSGFLNYYIAEGNISIPLAEDVFTLCYKSYLKRDYFTHHCNLYNNLNGLLFNAAWSYHLGVIIEWV